MLSSAARTLLAGLTIARLLAGADESARRFAPSYASSSLLHAASQETGSFAPNTIVTLYGRGLAYVTRAVSSNDIRDGFLPTILPGTGVRVLFDNIAVPLYFVAPGQVNLLLPADAKEGLHRLYVSLDGQAGPMVDVRIAAAAPGLFLQQPGLVIAVRLDGSLVSLEKPAEPGDTIILFATGLGATAGTAAKTGELAKGAAALAKPAALSLSLNGRAVPPNHIFYAGLAPGFAGLYQINLRLPLETGSDPEISLMVNGLASAKSVRLAVRANAAAKP